MKILKNEVARFFALGFLGGAALVMGTLGLDAAMGIASGVVPPAQAATSR